MPERDRTERDLFAAIEARRSDPEFMARLRRHVDENRVVLDRLAETDDLVEPTCDPVDGIRHSIDPTRCPGNCYRCPGCPRCADRED